MGHVPHVYVPGPWDTPVVSLEQPTLHHLRKVLRVRDGEPLSYTDGAGTVGTGSLVGEGLERGDEVVIPLPTPTLTVAVAPPQRSERARYVVEKCAELGVDRLVWLDTRHGEARPPAAAKAARWAVAALEQSRGGWLMETGVTTTPAALGAGVYVADARGGGWPAQIDDDLVLCIGPEGGWADDEFDGDQPRIALGERVLRVETAAVVGAAMALDRLQRLR